MTARTTGKDNDNSKDNDSKDNGDNGKNDNNDGGNNNSGGGSGGGGKIGGEVGGVVRSVAWLVAVFFTVGCLALTHRRNCRDMLGNKFILINSFRHVRTCQIEFILFIYSGLGINRLYQLFW